jgi:transmembrane sensor
MKFLSEHSIPWDLIISSLQKGISPEDEAQLQIWISSSDENRDFFSQLKQTWAEGLDDYVIYQVADETLAWNALRLKIEDKGNEEKTNGRVAKGDFNKRPITLFRWASVAAIFIIAAGLFIWYNTNSESNIYQTGKNEQQTVLLEDGSSIKLYADSRIEISKSYNKTDRIINFLKGDAFFEVQHIGQIPFIVNMGTTSVKDIGTSFYIHNTNDSINVSVKSGEVAFINNTNNDTRELSAGMSLKFQAGKNNSAPVILIDSATSADQNLLNFDNMIMSEVILKLQEAYGKKIILADSLISQKRFKANLEGQTFEEAMEILSKSLNIKYYKENDVYYLKTEQ